MENNEIKTQLLYAIYNEFIQSSFINLENMMLKKDHTFEFIEKDILIKMYLPYVYDYIQNYILKNHNFFEYQIIRSISPLIDTSKTILDIGANIGNHTIYFSKILKCNKIIAFEPQKNMQSIFEKNMKLNEIDNVIFNKFALSDKKQNLSIKIFNQMCYGETSFTIDENGEYEAKALDELNLTDVQFVKMDVEEHELNVLKGGEKLFKQQKPILWIEIHNESPTRNDVINLLDTYGYVFSKKIDSIDYIFIPKS